MRIFLIMAISIFFLVQLFADLETTIKKKNWQVTVDIVIDLFLFFGFLWLNGLFN